MSPIYITHLINRLARYDTGWLKSTKKSIFLNKSKIHIAAKTLCRVIFGAVRYFSTKPFDKQI